MRIKLILLAALFAPLCAHASIGTSICTSTTAAAPMTCSPASVTSGAELVLSITLSGLSGADPVTSITGCGVTNWQLATSYPVNLSSNATYVYYAENVATSGTCTLTVNLTGVPTDPALIVVQYPPGTLSTSFSFDQPGLSTFTGAASTLSVAAQQAGEVVVTIVSNGCGSATGTYSSPSGSSLVGQVTPPGNHNTVGFFDTTTSGAGQQTVTTTATSLCGFGSGVIASFRATLPAYGRLQQNVTTCTTATCAVTLKHTIAGDIALVQPTQIGCQDVAISSSNSETVRQVPASTGCETAPQYFILAGGDTTITSTSVSPIGYLAAEELTGTLRYWNGSAFVSVAYTNPLTTYNVTGAGTCYLVAPYALKQISTTASAGYWPLVFSPTGTDVYVWWETVASGGSPYSNVANTGTTQPGSYSALYSFCSAPVLTPQALQAAWTGPSVTFPTQNAVVPGHSLIVHSQAGHSSVTWTISSSPSNTWVQVGGCGPSDFFCDWIAWSAAAGVTTFTVPAASVQSLYQEVSHLSSIRHSVYTAPATGSTSYTTGTVSAAAGDYLLAFDSCQGGFTGCTPSGQNSANTWTLRNDGAWTDDGGNQAFDQIAPTTTTYALPFTIPSTGYNASSSIYDFIPAPTPVLNWQMGGPAKLGGAAQAQ